MSESGDEVQADGEGETEEEDDLLTNPRLAALIDAIADGREVDWQEAEATAASEEELKQIRSLQTIAEIATFQREWMADAGLADPLDDEEEPAEIPDRWGELEILERIGRGSFGDVYKAREPRLDRIVALKLIRPSRRRSEREEETLREGRLLARVRHPNVATVHGAAGAEGRVGFWMEYLEGKNLGQLLEEKGRFEPREAAEIGVSLCRALMAVHGQGIVHRDIKAQNVVREQDGRIVLTDFGVGRDVRLDGEETSLSGTPLYLAPELFEGDAPSPASDLYALGVLLFYLVTGEFPITGGSLDELRAAHRERKRRWLKEVRSDLPGTYVAAVERALDRDPKNRGDETRLERELGRFLGERQERRRRFRWTLAASILVSFLAAGYWTFVHRKEIEARVCLYRSDRLHEEGEREGTIRSLEKARKLAPSLAGIYWRLMSYQTADGDYDAAFRAADESDQWCAESQSRDCYLVKGWKSLLFLKYDLALENFEAANDIDYDEETQSQIVQAQLNLVRPEVAVKEARVLATAKGIGEAATLVTTMSAAGMHAEALKELRLLQEGFEDSSLIHWTAGEVLTAAGRYAEGEQEYRRMSEKPGEVGDVSNGRLSIAQSLSLQGRCDEAQVVLASPARPKSQEKFARNDAIRALLLARCNQIEGEGKEATRILQSIEKLQKIPTYLKLFRNAGLEALRAGDIGLASRFAGIVNKLALDSGDLGKSADLQLRGELARVGGNFDQALQWLEEAHELRPDPQNNLSLARLHVESNQCNRASKYLSSLIQSRGLIVDDFYTPWTNYNDALDLKAKCSAQ